MGAARGRLRRFRSCESSFARLLSSRAGPARPPSLKPSRPSSESLAKRVNLSPTRQELPFRQGIASVLHIPWRSLVSQFIQNRRRHDDFTVKFLKNRIATDQDKVMKRGGIRDDHGHGLIPQVVLEFLKVVIRKHAPFGKKLFPGPVVQAQQLTRAPAGNSSLGVSAEDHPFQRSEEHTS